MRELKIGKNDAGQRLDKFLSKAFPTMPSAFAYKAIRTKKIKLDRKRAFPQSVLCEGQTLQCFIPEEFFMSLDGEENAFVGLKPNLNVVYEDENIIVADKPTGMLSHSDDGGEVNTLIDNIKAYLYQKNEYDPENEMSFAPSLCNRIDRNTCGLVIAAKNAEALRYMNEQIKKRNVKKYYMCAVHGVMEKKEATLTAYLTKDSKTNTVNVYSSPAHGRMKIITKYKVLKQKSDCALLEVELITGKTHQIRSHMAFVGHPLIGEGKYGVNREDKKKGYRHQALYSYKIVFDFENEGFLGYLSGKEITADKKNIGFLRDFGL